MLSTLPRTSWMKLLQSLNLKLKQPSSIRYALLLLLWILALIKVLWTEWIVERLESLAKQKDLIGLKEATLVTQNAFSKLPTTCLIDESEIFGRQDDIAKIMKLLVPERDFPIPVQLIAIVGMPGIGKTALAQLLFNDQRVENHFDLCAWAYVSEEFDVSKVTRTILESVTMQDCNVTDLNVLQVMLKKVLAGKFLLCLDDIWNENFFHWDALQKPFKYGLHGSTIIVTTRTQSVPIVVRSNAIHHLPYLSYEDCLSLFQKHAFHNANPNDFPDLKAIGEQIVSKCCGLPLAVKTLGCLLHSKLKAEQWTNILNSELWDLPNDKSNLLSELRVSYHYLPSHLKRCFAFCSIFPKGYQIEKRKLVLLWMAEGLLPRKPEGKKRIEEVGEEYFQELLSRSLFHQSSERKSHFAMHDLINDLARFEAGEFCFHFEDGSSPQISKIIRHLSYFPKREEPAKKIEAFFAANCLRTFLPLTSANSASANISDSILDDIFPAFPYLRVLSLSTYGIRQLPASIDKLKHLRYLDFSHTRIRELPETVSLLYNLETLLLSNCQYLKELPTHTLSLINLRHLDITSTKLNKMPPHLSRLKTLQVLTDFVVSNNVGSKVGELGNLLHLRGKLSISNLQNVDNASDASKADLKGKKHLDELVYSWTTDDHKPNEELILDNLRPHESLRKLTIDNYGGIRFSAWLGDAKYSNMVHLRLSNCKNCLLLPQLGLLSSLKELYIGKMEKVVTVVKLYGNGTLFRSLETLQFEAMPSWKEWSHLLAQGGEFPSLQNLNIRECPLLTGSLPNNCPLLQSLRIQNCGKLSFLVNNAMQQYGALEILYINNSSLESFPLDFFTRLKELHIEDCSHLQSLHISEQLDGNLAFLEKLVIKNCSSLTHFPPRGLPAPNLTSISVSKCCSLLSMPMRGHLMSLKSLSISNCDELIIKSDNWDRNSMVSLASFEMQGGFVDVSSFPEGLLPASLTSLHINGLRDLESLDCWGLQHLRFLTMLDIHCCDNLQCLPAGGLPQSLSILIIYKCSRLIPRCQRNVGLDWQHISHIRTLDIKE